MAEFDWNDLQVLLAVGRTGKLSAAASRLGADHTTVSRRITALEEALGAKLLERRPTGCTLTDQGKRLMERAEAIERLALEALSDLEQTGQPVAGKVRIGAPEAFGSYFLAPRLQKLCDQYPAMEIELVAMPTLFSLSKREADLAIGLTAPEQGRLYSRKLMDYRLGLYAARSYLAAREPITALEQVREHRIIGYIEDLLHTSELANLIDTDDTACRPLRSSNLIAQMQATAAGAGLCVLPKFIAGQAADLVPVLADQFTLTRSLYLVGHDDLRDLARIKATADFITEAVRAERDAFI